MAIHYQVLYPECNFVVQNPPKKMGTWRMKIHDYIQLHAKIAQGFFGTIHLLMTISGMIFFGQTPFKGRIYIYIIYIYDGVGNPAKMTQHFKKC